MTQVTGVKKSAFDAEKAARIAGDAARPSFSQLANGFGGHDFAGAPFPKGTGATAGASSYVFSKSFSTDATLSRLWTYISTAGNLRIAVYSKSGDVFTLVSVSGSIAVPTGFVSLTPEDFGAIRVEAGQLLAIVNDTARFVYNNVATSAAPYYSSPSLAPASFTDTELATSIEISVRFEVDLATGGTVAERWKGKTLVTFGDSITWYDGNRFAATHSESGQLAVGYQHYAFNRLGCRIDNQGQSSATMPVIYTDKVLSYNYADAYAVTLTSGANDQRLSVAVGTVGAIGGTFSTTTFTGAMQASIEHIIAQNKATKIILVTPVRGFFFNTPTVPINRAYATAIKDLAQLYGLPVCDFYDRSGINELNYRDGAVPYYIGDNDGEPYAVHPTNLGYRRMGELYAETLALA